MSFIFEEKVTPTASLGRGQPSVNQRSPTDNLTAKRLVLVNQRCCSVDRRPEAASRQVFENVAEDVQRHTFG